ncbi:MAG: hypothetical protein RLZZ292_512 [Bacteroidota bacterium]|jgi:toxin YoeB
MMKDPRTGIGKPERLRHQDGEDVWSRRINEKDSLIYSVLEDDSMLLVQSVIGHYGDK